MDDGSPMLIGIVYPGEADVAGDMGHWLPREVDLAIERIPVHRPNGVYDIEAALASALRETLVDAAGALAELRPQALVYACTSGSSVLGATGDAETSRAMGGAAGAPCISTSAAIVEACRKLGAVQIGLVTPYLPEVTAALVDYLGEGGVEVPETRSLSSSGAQTFANTPMEDVEEACRSLASSDIDAVVIACTALGTSGIVERLAADLGTPVLTANQASMWAAVRLAGGDLSLRTHPVGQTDGRMPRASPAAAAKEWAS